jgi:hypothetical protein
VTSWNVNVFANTNANDIAVSQPHSNFTSSIDPFEESEEDKIARLAREKAEKIDLILNNK